jgi:predicted secreted acid phosphatase
MFQQEMRKENPNSSSYNRFGVSYFILPNPLYGSWQVNKH